jgi:SAM-dependent methyltransferase
MDEIFLKSLDIHDFEKAFGADKDEVSFLCGELIANMDFRYKVCPQKWREKIFLDIIKKCDNKKFSVSGPHRKCDWSKGWGEILQHFHSSDKDIKSLTPKDIHGDRPLRYNNNYIISNSNSFEHDFSTVFRNWLFKKYFRDYENIYEFGCGTGHNLALLATIFPDKRFFGMDWVPESQKIINAISEKYGWQIRGFRFDFFDPNYDLKILPNSLVYTSAALEQLGSNHTNFINFLLANRPSLCVNVECIAEHYCEDCLFDYVALKYHKTRNYLNGYLTRLRELEKEKVVKIITTKRLGFGSLYHEVFSYVVWKVI